MANNRTALLISFLIVLSAAVGSASAASASSGNSTMPSAYDMLERYSFPRGILPEGVQRYELRPDGSFEVFFSGAGGCELRIPEGYVLWYDRRVAGTVEAGSIRALEGVSVKVWFAWLGVTVVRRAGDQLIFLVGPVAASFPLGNFAYSPRCSSSRRSGDAAAAS